MNFAPGVIIPMLQLNAYSPGASGVNLTVVVALSDRIVRMPSLGDLLVAFDARDFAIRCCRFSHGAGPGYAAAAGEHQAVLDVERTKQHHRHAGNAKEMTLKRTPREAGNHRERKQSGQGAKRKNEHGKRADREATLGKHVELQGLRETAR